jgi:hypothetical protein
LVTIASFTEPWEAHIFRLRLQAEGVPAFVAHEHHVWQNWPYALALGGVKVQVPRSATEKASDVERRCRAGQYRAELAAELGDLDDARCPDCGSNRIESRRFWFAILLLLLSYAIAQVIFPLGRRVHRCAACGTGWREGMF